MRSIAIAMVRILSAVKWKKMKKVDAVLMFNWYKRAFNAFS